MDQSTENSAWLEKLPWTEEGVYEVYLQLFSAKAKLAISVTVRSTEYTERNASRSSLYQTVKGEFNARRDHKGKEVRERNRDRRLFLEAGYRKLYRPSEARRLSRRPSAKSPDDR
ncbi:uncharacterized protein RAG0_04815 [Rhynchosporium agropyri]|uniref:Uncharacterized protein n=1 Tax=Rhynchosporium agropyri TaxID=914238 RepID=A0A1E1KAE8_9HELO|nr:uncharacterized protein RAG0_04815 [Rhynchosporium agropyri]